MGLDLPAVQGEEVISLATEEMLIRDALHIAATSGKSSSLTGLIQAQSMLRSTQNRLDDFTVTSKKQLVETIHSMIDSIAELCMARGYKYDTEKTKQAASEKINAATNNPDDSLRRKDKPKSRRQLPDSGADSARG